MTTVEHTTNLLVKELNNLPIYRFHRHNLRPWDRPLPVLVAQEADAQQHWEMAPPTPKEIFGSLFGCLALYQLLWLLPILVNYEHLGDIWKNIAIPGIVYNEPKVWMALWIVSHLSSGLTLWFIWLTGGLTKHVPELLPIAFSFFIECLWVDVVASAKRLDIVVGMWVLIMLALCVSVVLLWKKKIGIGSIFLLPHTALSIVMIVYSAAFAALHGSTYTWLGDVPRSPAAQPLSSV